MTIQTPHSIESCHRGEKKQKAEKAFTVPQTARPRGEIYAQNPKLLKAPYMDKHAQLLAKLLAKAEKAKAKVKVAEAKNRKFNEKKLKAAKQSWLSS